ncbi:MAG: Fe-S cluster assembly ATPase SufC, partial [Gammaproteobacteria bacterium]|nr:Fe-S cluster assembly ATPase SufC [Gammaproteobacteria bacterium]
AHRGVFLSFQFPVEIPGVSNMVFLKAALDSQNAAAGEAELSAIDFMRRARAAAARLDLNPEFLKRGVNEGFSGGEKKRNEILQMLLLEPALAVLDETDSGLDIDALRVVAAGVNAFASPDNAVVLVTHYQRLLDHIVPDYVHVLVDGRIARTGDKALALELESNGYGWLARDSG